MNKDIEATCYYCKKKEWDSRMSDYELDSMMRFVPIAGEPTYYVCDDCKPEDDVHVQYMERKRNARNKV